MKTFEELWRDIQERARRWAIPIVQDYKELEYVFNLIKGCDSYLEVGTAEGNGLYVLSHALSPIATIRVIDFGEKHTSPARNEAIERIPQKRFVEQYLGNSHSKEILDCMEIEYGESGLQRFDVVFIDAGHSYEDVIADAIAYGHLATKYIIFHDIQLEPVRNAVNWYRTQNPQFKYHEFINSPSFGYGILEV